MNNYMNSIIDRALGENQGSALFTKKTNGKYSFFLPLTNLGELGATPEQIEKTVIGNMAKTYIQGRKDNPQQTMTFYVHRDNMNIVKEVDGETLDFIRIFPDFSAISYSGKVGYKVNDNSLDAAEQGEISITISTDLTYVDNAYALIEDTAMFVTDIPSVVGVEGTGTKVINITTNPADATVAVTGAGTTSVATAVYSEGKVTITGVATGSSVVEITASKTGYNSFKRTIMIIVK